MRGPRENKKREKRRKERKRILAFLLIATMLLPFLGSSPAVVNAAAANTSGKLAVTNVPQKSKTMYVGSSFALEANQKVKSYASNNKSVAEVDKNGVIYAKKKGNAVITVTGTNGTKKKVKVIVKKAKYYEISKKAGTYQNGIKVKIKAKKGYKVYYTTSGKFKTGKQIKSNKSKVLSVKKTTTLLLYAVKASEKVTVKQLNTAAKRNNYAYYVQYRYTIGENQESGSEVPDQAETPDGNSENSGNTESTGTESSETESKNTESVSTESSETESKNTESVSTESSEIESKSTESVSTESSETESKSTESSETESKSTESVSTESSETESKSTESVSTESSETESKNTESSETESKDTESVSTESSETESKNTESSETESKNTESVSTESSETESRNTESAGTESSETESKNTESSETESGSTQSSETRTEDEIAVQTQLNEASAGFEEIVPDEIAVTASAIEEETPQIVLSSDGASCTGVSEDAVTCSTEGNYQMLTIQKAGTYVLSGGTEEAPLTNFVITVGKNIEDEVNLIWNQLVIDNSALGTAEGEDVPVFSVGKSTPNVNITLKGTSILTGNGSYTTSPAAVIYASDAGTTLTFSAYAGDDTAGLTVKDAMDSATDFGENDPADGISVKGTLVFKDGVFAVTSNGDCIKGTGKKGAGGVRIYGGTYTLCSQLGSGIKSKNGIIAISGGNVESTYTAGDGIQAKNYDIFITGGQVKLDNCYGDGIQGENVYISGEDTVIDIKTYFENAGINYYNSSLGTGNYNTMSTSESSKTEVVNVDTGSHKGIKGGTKACTYSYQSVADDSDYTAGTTYTTEASGGIVITGGTITIDTTNTGIKYNGGMGGGQGGFGSSSSSSGSGNLSAANSDGQYIIGAPDDAIHSNNSCTISGGNITIASADDGITAKGSVLLLNGCNIAVEQCYEGIEGGEILMGASDGATETPVIVIYSNDDGLNAASKSSITYVYADESEEQYTKTEISSKENVFKMLDGYLNIMIADDQTHSFSLATEAGTDTTGTYTADGDGIDCNGSFYAYGGTIIVYGPNSGSNAPIDTDDVYYIGDHVEFLAVGSVGMTETPDTAKQAVITYASSGNSGAAGGPGMSGRPGSNTGNSSSSSISAGTAFAILDADNNVVLAIKPIKTYSYVMYSSPELETGASYQQYSGGSVTGSLVREDSTAYDYRYTGYDTSGATSLGTVTAR